MTVAQFYTAVLAALGSVGIDIRIDERPSEIAGAIPFSRDHSHGAYDRRYVERFGQVLRQCDQVFKKFRSGFLGKSSPVHFFWGSFDLAVTRFSGRPAPLFGGKAPGLRQDVMQEAYSHEVSSAGFWPGSADSDAAFYSYAYPVPPGFKEYRVRPQGAFFSESLGEYLLPYAQVRAAKDPEAELLGFLQSTYEAAAVCGRWDRDLLECAPGEPGVPRGRSA